MRETARAVSLTWVWSDSSGESRLEPGNARGDDGTWYREESKDMAKAIRDGKLLERVRVSARDL